jgi:hypothetical protein
LKQNIIIKKDDGQNERFIKLPEVTEYFASNHDKKARDMVNEMLAIEKNIKLSQHQIISEYKEIEEELLDREKHMELLKNMKNKKEDNLKRHNLLF